MFRRGRIRCGLDLRSAFVQATEYKASALHGIVFDIVVVLVCVAKYHARSQHCKTTRTRMPILHTNCCGSMVGGG